MAVRELKERLSYYLRMVREGETVVITSRGTPVVRLVPAGRDLQQQITSLQGAGLIEWSGQKLRLSLPSAKARQGKSVSEILVEGRR